MTAGARRLSRRFDSGSTTDSRFHHRPCLGALEGPRRRRLHDCGSRSSLCIEHHRQMSRRV